MQIRELYHGTTGDNILQIIRDGTLMPNAEGKVFFSERNLESVLMHGADLKRKLTLAVKLKVSIPEGAALQKAATAGVADTLIVTSSLALPAQVLELYVREPRASTITTIKGAADIAKYLSA